MTNKIVSYGLLPKIIARIKSQKKSIVLVGGCFDIFHIGHLRFLQSAKKTADVLLIALESDPRVKTLKGDNRPIHSQNERAEILSELSFVDYILLLPDFSSDQEYFELVKIVQPNVIAVTQNDQALEKKKQQVSQLGGKLEVVTPYLNTPSTTQLTKLLKID